MAQSIVMPSFGMYTSEGKLVTWVQPSGAAVQAGQVIAEIETEKAVHELPSIGTGTLHHVAAVGAMVKEEDLIGYILADGEAPPEGGVVPAGASSNNREAASAPARSFEPGDPIKASPIAKNLAKEHGIDLSRLRGTGPGGRIVESDVKAAVERQSAERLPPQSSTPGRRVPMAAMRRTIAARLRQSADTAVSLTLTREVEADTLVAARASANATRGNPIPVDAYFAKLLAAALCDRPELNSAVAGDDLVIFDEVHVGIAVSVPEGLVVPVVRNVGATPLALVGERIRDLAARARANALRAPDLADGTCTITNLGASGVDAFTPILNPPQSCILGIGRIRPRAVPRNGTLGVAQTCVLSLTFDHRVSDGVPAAEVLDGIARRMNDAEWLAQLAMES